MADEQSPGILDNRYEVGAVIGVGGMAEVRAGFDRRLGREVALKFLRPDLAEQSDVCRRFEEEARSAARISHAAAVTVFDSGESDGVPYLVTERLPGRTLADQLADGPIPEHEVVELAVDVLGALDAAHRLGIIHRDVKPANLLYTANGRMKLADFGIAKSAEALDHTMTGQVIGTPAYLAPERLRGQPATPASDLYSLGVVMYEALTGRKPFHADTPLALAYAIDNTEPEPLESLLPSIDRDLAATIARALAKNPAARYHSAAAMTDSLLGRRLAPANATTASETTTRAVRRPDPTAVMTPTAPTHDPPSQPARRAFPPSPSLGTRRWYIAAAASALVLILVLVARDGGDNPNIPSTPSTTTAPASPTSPLPDALDRAIDELERSVQP